MTPKDESDLRAAIPAGMKPWHGGDSAPADWDEDGPVMLSGGFTFRQADQQDPIYWGHDHDDIESDVIAYTPKLTSDHIASPSGEEAATLEWIAKNLASAKENLAKCEREVEAFSQMDDALREGLGGAWERHRVMAAQGLQHWQTISNIVNDRNEWRVQHENLLSVRASDLATFAIPSPAQQSGELREAVEHLETAKEYLLDGGAGTTLIVREIEAAIEALASTTPPQSREAELVAEIEALQAAHVRLLQAVLGAIDTGRSEPLFIVRDQVRNYLADLASTEAPVSSPVVGEE